MNNDQIVANFSTIISIILTNKSTILITVITVTLLRYILKTLHNRRQFPILTVKQTPTKPIYCAVCLYDVVEGQRYRRLPKCHHCFHVSCVDTWLQSRSTCPLCRSQIPVHLLPRKQKEEPGFLYLFVYFSVKAIRQKISSNFSKIVLVDADEL
ncbi:putative transcription factor C2H2 family [Helianthus annuus]|uniref:Putative zinc finger, RING/FYVE/PHD-type n=1 Tax=Helianthus annuus TaxID=4232 RepID=A0A251S1Q1_HELAN|nr:putative transcription factor C2H2 family [Helianthus annuus]KAJ0439187.1 putative transcription factor C2H2 family [Helianthus annuus]KAJ0444206.1 putative transcription factor C2H2 family [Helianthus annuus]KAJ0461537.1 putative transcription factor C2H2 family [Helianthus annuus]KAJ0641964.1 putative transcription factor C2H2 family [Helianthus annuus]